MATTEGQPHKHRTLWISDVHLGTPGCKAARLVNFLEQHHCEELYIVGDFVDGWKLKNHLYWPRPHSRVIRSILAKSSNGTRVHYILGNHDEFLRTVVRSGVEVGNINFAPEAIHVTADGRRLLVIHGDAFDIVTNNLRWLALTGDKLYALAIRANKFLNRARRRLGKPHWSLSAFAKQRVKAIVNFISNYEEALADECKHRKLDGVVCGHIHHAEIRNIDGITYHNCGDWIDSCTALAEDFNGRISIVHWTKASRRKHTGNGVSRDRQSKAPLISPPPPRPARIKEIHPNAVHLAKANGGKQAAGLDGAAH